ncbi:MAG: UDP-2,3-diacylglucosamine diphosphatase [Gammaproteobacteria bacterium]|nr:UDP-2,3-diacylglucosamine diphosphatase [Gammaproteobacteria bacterium]
MTTLFISDLHLTADRPKITALFLDFLKGEARTAEALYILGDFFEYWIGDEAVAQAEFQPIIDGLRALTASGVPTYFMHGNRDFLVGEGFERATGCRVIADPTVVDLYGTPVLLMHGDSLCTDDVEHQKFRAIVRDEQWQQAFLTKSVAERVAIARSYREMSREATSQKAAEIMDVTQTAVATALKQHNVRLLIHGHTHRPAVHTLDIDDAPARRIVLGDWYEQGSVLRCDANGCELSALPLAR